MVNGRANLRSKDKVTGDKNIKISFCAYLHQKLYQFMSDQDQNNP